MYLRNLVTAFFFSNIFSVFYCFLGLMFNFLLLYFYLQQKFCFFLFCVIFTFAMYKLKFGNQFHYLLSFFGEMKHICIIIIY